MRREPIFPIEKVARLGPALRDLRHHQDVTLKDAGDAMGSAETTISSWETGRKLIRVDKLIELLAAYEYTMVLMDVREFHHYVTWRATR